MDYNIYKPKKRKKDNIMLEDSICANQLIPFFRLMQNIGRIEKTTKIYKNSNEVIHPSIGWHIKQKKLGKVKGMPDYIITWQMDNCNTFGWIEVKQPKGYITASQKEFAEGAISRNEPHAFVTSKEEFETILKKWKLLK